MVQFGGSRKWFAAGSRKWVAVHENGLRSGSGWAQGPGGGCKALENVIPVEPVRSSMKSPIARLPAEAKPDAGALHVGHLKRWILL